MYSVLLDENNYFTGSYAEVGSIVGGAEVAELPSDIEKAVCYRLEECQWVFDSDKWEELQNPPPSIEELKSRISATDYKIVKCSEYQLAGLPFPYDVALLHEERQRLRDMINELENELE